MTRRNWLAGSMLIGLLALALPSQGQAQTSGMRLPCHAHGEISKQLMTKYKEQPISLGMQTNGNLLQVYASQEKGTWTIISTTPKGKTCILAAGKSWESLPTVSNDPEA
ncbi:MAG: hypothetical protein ACFB6S_06435 [Geminicoccaceae bacterium]